MEQIEHFYAVLGVNPTATEAEIKAAYRKLVKASHPDLHKGDPTAAKRFREIQQAFELVTDPKEWEKFKKQKAIEKAQAERSRRAAEEHRRNQQEAEERRRRAAEEARRQQQVEEELRRKAYEELCRRQEEQQRQWEQARHAEERYRQREEALRRQKAEEEAADRRRQEEEREAARRQRTAERRRAWESMSPEEREVEETLSKARDIMKILEAAEALNRRLGGGDWTEIVPPNGVECDDLVAQWVFTEEGWDNPLRWMPLGLETGAYAVDVWKQRYYGVLLSRGILVAPRRTEKTNTGENPFGHWSQRRPYKHHEHQSLWQEAFVPAVALAAVILLVIGAAFLDVVNGELGAVAPSTPVQAWKAWPQCTTSEGISKERLPKGFVGKAGGLRPCAHLFPEVQELDPRLGDVAEAYGVSLRKLMAYNGHRLGQMTKWALIPERGDLPLCPVQGSQFKPKDADEPCAFIVKAMERGTGADVMAQLSPDQRTLSWLTKLNPAAAEKNVVRGDLVELAWAPLERLEP